jgi:hypothetical protein
LDQLVSWRKVCSVRIVVVRLNQLGMPAQAFDDTYGDAKLLLNAIEIIRERFKCGLIRMSRYRVYWSWSQGEEVGAIWPPLQFGLLWVSMRFRFRRMRMWYRLQTQDWCPMPCLDGEFSSIVVVVVDAGVVVSFLVPYVYRPLLLVRVKHDELIRSWPFIAACTCETCWSGLVGNIIDPTLFDCSIIVL